MRVSSQVAGFARKIRPLGHHDWRVRFEPTAAIHRKNPGLPRHLFARLIRYQRPGFRHSYLLTSLDDPRQFRRDELIDLYHARWRIETIYREWKRTLDIQNLRSHTPLGIMKEIHAQLLTSNLVRWIMTEAVSGTPQTPVDLSFSTAVSYVRSSLLPMLCLRPDRIAQFYQQLLALIRAARIRKRPGRSYPRPFDGKIKNLGYGKRKLPAKLRKSTGRRN
jgi:hypothetical protein